MYAKYYSLLCPVFALVLISFLAEPAVARLAPDIPPGSEIHVRMIDSLSSATAHLGDIFHGTLDQPIMVNGKQVFPKGADVTGTVAGVHPSGRLSDPGELDLVLNTISSGDIASSVTVEPMQIKGESHKKSNVTKVGGGAALGAIIGAIAGGGKGAAIGTVAGAGAGAGAAAATGKKEATVESEAVLSFMTKESQGATTSATSTPASNNPAKAAEPQENRAPAPSGSAEDQSFANAVLFTARDRRVIRNCLSGHAADLPSGTLERQSLPPGSDREVRVGNKLPTDLQGRVQSLPLACEEQLPQLPKDQERAIYNGRVMLLDKSDQILDLFDVNEAK